MVPVEPETEPQAIPPSTDSVSSKPVGSASQANTIAAASDDDPVHFNAGDRRFLTWSLVVMTLLLSWHGWRAVARNARPIEILRAATLEPDGVDFVASTTATTPIATDAAPRTDDQSAPDNPTAIRLMIDVNTAGWHEWTQLPGIGDTLAQRIVADRQAHGPFRTIDELTRVKGIGEKTLEKLRPHLKPVAP